VGRLITAEIKAPWVILHKDLNERACSADNMFKGTVEKITPGKINTEYIVRISDDTEVCSIVTSESSRRLGLMAEDAVWVTFNSYSVVLTN
jgi:molybdate transport system regulatory protein